MRTAVEEMLHYIENNDINNILEYKDTMRIICRDLLNKERTQIINAYEQGRKDSYEARLVYELRYTSRDYYNETFNKEQQRELLKEIIQADEKDGLYDDWDVTLNDGIED